MVGLFKPSLTLGASKFWNPEHAHRMKNNQVPTEWKQWKKWNQVLKLASKTRKAKSQMDPFQILGSYETKFWNWHLRQGRPSLRWIHFKTMEIMNLSFEMGIQDKEGQVPDSSMSKLIRWKQYITWSENCGWVAIFLPAHSHPCPYSGLEPLFRVYYPCMKP